MEGSCLSIFCFLISAHFRVTSGMEIIPAVLRANTETSNHTHSLLKPIQKHKLTKQMQFGAVGGSHNKKPHKKPSKVKFSENIFLCSEKTNLTIFKTVKSKLKYDSNKQLYSPLGILLCWLNTYDFVVDWGGNNKKWSFSSEVNSGNISSTN